MFKMSTIDPREVSHYAVNVSNPADEKEVVSFNVNTRYTLPTLLVILHEMIKYPFTVQKVDNVGPYWVGTSFAKMATLKFYAQKEVKHTIEVIEIVEEEVKCDELLRITAADL